MRYRLYQSQIERIPSHTLYIVSVTDITAYPFTCAMHCISHIYYSVSLHMRYILYQSQILESISSHALYIVSFTYTRAYPFICAMHCISITDTRAYPFTCAIYYISHRYYGVSFHMRYTLYQSQILHRIPSHALCIVSVTDTIAYPFTCVIHCISHRY